MANIELQQLAKTSFALEEGKTSGTNSKIELQAIARAKLLTYVVDKSLFYLLCIGTQTIAADELSLKVVKNQASSFVKKTGIGTGSFNNWKMSAPIVVEWDEPLKALEAYTAVEKQMGTAISAPAKVELLLNKFSRGFERSSFAKLEEKIIEDNKLEQFKYLEAKEKDIWKKVVAAATKLSQTIDPTQGLDLIDPSKIIIMFKPTVLDLLAAEGFTGDRANVAFSGGQYSITTTGGYQAIANPFLNKFDIVITTNFVAAGAMNLIAVNSGTVDNLSNDGGVYVEGMMASKIIWDNLAFGFYSTDTAPSKSNKNEFIELPNGIEKLKDTIK